MMTENEVDTLIEEIIQCKAKIKATESERDEFIANAQKLCEEKCKPLMAEIAHVTEQLRQYVVDNLPEGKKSISRPRATMQFRTKAPKFYDSDGRELTGKSKPLMTLVKTNLPQYIKVTQEESVAWGALKKHLGLDGEQVYYSDEETGEIKFLEGLRGQEFPDDFTIVFP